MREQRNEISFRGQKIYVGIDVHLKSWSVTVLYETSVLKKFSQNPDPEALHGFLRRSYPGAKYRSVYEAGFCGFWIHERLTALGIDNIMINPTDVPTKSSEKLRKTDAVDSGKLTRSLRANKLKGIYTPDSVSLEIPRTAAVDYVRSGVRADYGNGVPVGDMRHYPFPQCQTTGYL